MDSVKYLEMDVPKEAISIAVLNSSGKLVMECVIETKANTILQFFQGLRGSLHVALEEGTCAAWLYNLRKPHVAKIVVCNPRRNVLLKEGSKSEKTVWPRFIYCLRNKLESSRMARRKKQTIGIEKTHQNPLPPFNQAATSN